MRKLHDEQILQISSLEQSIVSKQSVVPPAPVSSLPMSPAAPAPRVPQPGPPTVPTQQQLPGNPHPQDQGNQSYTCKECSYQA